MHPGPNTVVVALLLYYSLITTILYYSIAAAQLVGLSKYRVDKKPDKIVLAGVLGDLYLDTPGY